jgi:hypothetical protein
MREKGRVKVDTLKHEGDTFYFYLDKETSTFHVNVNGKGQSGDNLKALMKKVFKMVEKQATQKLTFRSYIVAYHRDYGGYEDAPEMDRVFRAKDSNGKYVYRDFETKNKSEEDIKGEPGSLLSDHYYSKLILIPYTEIRWRGWLEFKKQWAQLCKKANCLLGGGNIRKIQATLEEFYEGVLKLDFIEHGK